MEKIIIIGFGILVLMPLASAITLESGTNINPTDSNTTYILGNTMSFSNVIIRNDSIYFNDSIFQIEADSGITSVTINNLTSFNVTATDNVNFTLGGFSTNTDYDIEIDDTLWSIVTTNATGVLSFNYSSWSTHMFSIVLHINPASALSDGTSRKRPTEQEPEPEPTIPESPDYTIFWLISTIAISTLIIILIVTKKKKL